VCSQEAPDQKEEKLQTKRRRSFRLRGGEASRYNNYFENH
jgi:hypothetical protein